MTNATAATRGAAELIRGVYSFNGTVPEASLESGELLTMTNFGEAGLAAGKSVKFGRGALHQLVEAQFWLHARAARAARGEPMNTVWMPTEAENRIYLWLLRLMRDYNTDRTKNQSFRGFAVATELVHNVWLDGEGLRPSYPISRQGLGVGRMAVISVFFEQERNARQELDQEPAIENADEDVERE